MKNEKERLLKLVDSGKISEEDFQNLMSALEKKKSPLQNFLLFLISPSQKLSSAAAIGLGLIILLTMSALGPMVNVHFPGILDLQMALSEKNPLDLNFNILLYQNLISWLTLTLLFYLAARINQQKGLRIQDFLGAIALSRIPYLFVTGAIYLLAIFDPSITSSMEATSTSALAIGLLGIAGVSWQVTTYFQALKEASGLIRKKLWLSFIPALILAEAISAPLTRIFF